MSVLEHVYYPNKLLKNINLILKKTGLLFIEVPDSSQPIPSLTEYFGFEHLSHFTLNTLKKILNHHQLYIHSFDTHAFEKGIIRISASKSKKIIKLPKIKKNYLSIINLYKKQKKQIQDKFLKKLIPLIKKWQKTQARLAIYGAGGHTFYLLNLIKINNLVHCLIDTDPAKHGKIFLKWQIYRPEDILSLNLDAIIISSERFETEIYESIKHLEKTGLKIIKCYS